MNRPGGIRHRGHDARGQQRAERDYKARDDVQQCNMCGRLFTRYAKDRVCSIACAEKLKAQQQELAKG
jgi:hypothetical protein